MERYTTFQNLQTGTRAHTHTHSKQTDSLGKQTVIWTREEVHNIPEIAIDTHTHTRTRTRTRIRIRTHTYTQQADRLTR